MTEKKKNLNFGLIMAVYLLGIFMGALDTGIVTPARTIIQNYMGVSDTLGIWMITIYTLAYAASIPVMGKLADRAGRKYIYLVSIFLFGAGSLLCGLTEASGSFTMLLIARAVQAIGGGGIVPVATAEFGTTFPPEKRGMALGLVGGVYGVANIFGASAGSAILDIFGTNNWQFIFYVNVPITIFILIAGFVALPNTKEKAVSRIDGTGIMGLVIMILSIMYALKNIDFFDFKNSFTDTDVYPFFIAFFLLLPLFIFIEKKAEDPVMNLSYFTRTPILITLLLSVITGIVLMGLIFVPQLCENCMEVPSGNGGYFVIILGVFAGIGAPLSGKMTDKKGPKFVLGTGFIATIAGALYLIFVMTVHPGWATVIISLALIGTGIGFTMGAPLNYMMLDNTEPEESNSALATVSLVRSLGTVIAPAIMVGFLSHAGLNVQTNVMDLLPKEIDVPQIPYAQELQSAMDSQGIKGMPDLTSMRTVKIDMSADSDYSIPEDTLDMMQNSDVTTIVKNTKTFAKTMFTEMTPDIEKKITTGMDKGISGISSGITKMDKSITSMTKASSGIQKGIDGMTTAVSKQDASLEKMKSSRAGMVKAVKGLTQGIGFQEMMNGQLSGAQAYLSKIPLNGDSLESQLPEKMKAALSKPVLAQLAKMTSMEQLNGAISGCDASISSIEKKKDSLSTGITKIDSGITGLESGTKKVETKLTKMKSQKASIESGLSGIKSGKTEAEDTLSKLRTAKASVPSVFKQAEDDYIEKIDDKETKIQDTFRATLNEGFRQIYALAAIASAAGLLLLMLYRKKED